MVWALAQYALGLSAGWDMTFHHLLHLAPNIQNTLSFPRNMLYVISRTLGIHGWISVRGRVCKWVNRYVTVSRYIRYHWLEALGWVPLWIDFSPPVTHNVIIKSYKWSIYFEQCKAITFTCLTGYKVNKLNKIIVIVNLPALENTQWSLTHDRCIYRK